MATEDAELTALAAAYTTQPHLFEPAAVDWTSPFAPALFMHMFACAEAAFQGKVEPAWPASVPAPDAFRAHTHRVARNVVTTLVGRPERLHTVAAALVFIRFVSENAHVIRGTQV